MPGNLDTKPNSGHFSSKPDPVVQSIGKDRLAITGARWSLPGAEAVLLLRAVITNGDFETYWKFHLQQEHQRTHTSPDQENHSTQNAPPSPRTRDSSDFKQRHWPGTSKWNKIEHKMFSFISINWRGRPLTDYQTILELIAHTTTETGLTVSACLDDGVYPTGVKVTNAELAAVPLVPQDFHGEWNYTISCGRTRKPRRGNKSSIK